MADDGRRDIIISCRVTQLQAAHLDAAAQANGRPRADYVRAAGLAAAGAAVPPPPAKLIRRPARRLPALDTQLLAKILAQLGQIRSGLDAIIQSGEVNGSPVPRRSLAALTVDIISMRDVVRAALSGDSDEEATA